ncbi:hypothetical protein ABZ208_02350 [Streptomyces sp. NPDC006208]|uniref:hypothetical protein n=1 Tax=Streptomyces sp. NPDC006208 TaxID=3156734 RepID=UPI0033BE6825
MRRHGAAFTWHGPFCRGKRLCQDGPAGTTLRVVRATAFGSGVRHIVHAPESV